MVRSAHLLGERSSFTLKSPLQALESRKIASGERMKDGSEEVNEEVLHPRKTFYAGMLGHGPRGFRARDVLGGREQFVQD